ncbi:MAG: protein involved in beta 3-glucan synthesis [Bacteroidetes bacterium]|nr:protein involved in beta 3-glucan synthesis [Bacteroidota bacterium]
MSAKKINVYLHDPYYIMSTTLKALLKGYKNLYGTPDTIIETDPGNKNAIQLVVYDPVPEDEIFDSAVCSAGFSNLSKVHSIEFRLEVKGKLTKTTVKEIGEFFKQIFELLEKEKRIHTTKVYNHLTIPLFKGMKSCMIIDSSYMSMEFLDEKNEKGRVLSLIPMFEKEGAELEKMNPGFSERIVASVRELLRDPSRKPTSVVGERMYEIWGKVADWYVEQGVSEAEVLRKAVKSKDRKAGDELEKALGFELLPDFKVSIDLINRKPKLKIYYSSTVKSIIDFWQSMNKMNAEGKFNGALHKLRGNPAIQQVWWHEKWVPFAMDSFGSHLVIDMAPGPDGEVGQVLLHDTIEGPLHTGFDSFFTWLDAYYTGLYTDEYIVEDGVLMYKE